MKETSKASLRRRKDPFWNEVFRGGGIDIGSGDDPLKRDDFNGITSVRAFDLEHGDAQVISRYVGLCSLDFVHSSNCLEHMKNPTVALLEWFSLLRPGGHLVFTVPDEDLYEQRVFPSRWNADHKWTFTIWKEGSWSRKSLNLAELLVCLHNAQVRRIHTADTFYDHTVRGEDQTFKGPAEAFIEVVVRKMPLPKGKFTFKHSGARGDLVYGLPAMAALGGGTLMVNLDPTVYVGKPMTEKEVEWLRDLLKLQPYVDDVVVWDGRQPDYDLDDFRETNVDANLLSRGHLVRFGVEYDLSKPWISLPDISGHDAIVVSRTGRYHGAFDWQELKPWIGICGFVGSEDEYEEFVKQTGLEMSLLHTPNYLALARTIAGAKLFVGNQSFPYSLAEAMKVPRVLEVCSQCPNCEPQSDNGFTRLTQGVIRHFCLGEPAEKRMVSSHVPWKLVQPKKLQPNRKARTGERSVMSCVVPYVDGFQKPIVKLCAGGLEAGAQVIVVGMEGMERALPEGVIIVEGKGTFEAMANIGAASSTGSVICVVDISKCNDFGVVGMVSSRFPASKLGMVGVYAAGESYPHPTGPVIAVSRRAYEECGLFNPEMISGPLNALEMSLRYAKKRYACTDAGLGKVRCRVPGDDANAEYIERVYGVTV